MRQQSTLLKQFDWARLVPAAPTPMQLSLERQQSTLLKAQQPLAVKSCFTYSRIGRALPSIHPARLHQLGTDLRHTQGARAAPSCPYLSPAGARQKATYSHYYHLSLESRAAALRPSPPRSVDHKAWLCGDARARSRPPQRRRVGPHACPPGMHAMMRNPSSRMVRIAYYVI